MPNFVPFSQSSFVRPSVGSDSFSSVELICSNVKKNLHFFLLAEVWTVIDAINSGDKTKYSFVEQ